MPAVLRMVFFEPRRNREARRLVDVVVGDLGELTAVRIHETVVFLNTLHASDETEGEGTFDDGVVIDEGSSLGSKGANIASSLVAEIGASKLGNPNVLSWEEALHVAYVAREVTERGSVPVDSDTIWLLAVTELAPPVLHPCHSAWCVGGGGRDEVITLIAEGKEVLPPPGSSSAFINVGLSVLVDFVHGHSDTIVVVAVDDIALEVLNVITTPEHGDESETAGERSIGSPGRPVVVEAGL